MNALLLIIAATVLVAGLILCQWNWPFPDPAAVNGTSEGKMQKVREIREMIKEKLVETVDKGFV